MYVIVGLGNPGKKYEHTRHNVGFSVIDEIAETYHITMGEEKFKAIIGKGVIAGQKVVLVKPQTFMNLSGESVRLVKDYFKIDETKELIVLYDDINLAPGQLRIRTKGSAGGHNGIKNIILHLGHERFLRVKIGVGEKPAGYDLADYVLGHFDKEERSVMEESFSKVVQAVEFLLTDGAEKAMNRFN